MSEKAKSIQELSEEQYTALVDKFLNECYTFRELQGVSDENMDTIYAVAYNLYQSGKYKDAAQVFQFLCMFDHFEKKYWLGLAACRQMLGLFQDAVAAYSFAAILDTNDPKVPLYAADCFLAMGDKEHAKEALNSVVAFAGDASEHKTLKERAEAILGFIDKDKKE